MIVVIVIIVVIVFTVIIFMIKDLPNHESRYLIFLRKVFFPRKKGPRG